MLKNETQIKMRGQIHNTIQNKQAETKQKHGKREALYTRDMNFPPNPKTKRIKFRATDSIYNSKNTM